ncbi:MAG: hypothetical protein HYZ28_28560 [Myxococcales bacterium]|nr:hypothetical protein [Myxococcales bacterium]
MPCDDGGTFSYPPSNFDPTRYALPDASVVIRCKAELNSSPDAGGYLRGWCASSDSPDFYLLQQDGGEEALLAVMSSLTVTDAGTLALTGDRPVLLAVYGNAEIAGQLAAKSVSGRPPAGGSAPRGLGPKPHCALGTGGNGSYGNTTSGGGGGGAFGSDGAPGGAALGAGPLSYGVAGQQNGNLLLVPLRGGCAGGNGGPAERADKGGFGGGALQVSVAGTLLVTGRVAAPGEGGEGGTIGNDTGGGAGGGGSGGGVLLEASRLFIVSGAVVSANGGSGGEGDPDPGGGTSGNSGNPGRVDDAQAAPGGRGGGLGGDGGDGGTLLFAPTAGSSGPAGGNEPGGGGGGGSVGRIQLNVPALGSCVVDAGLITPAPAGNCP